MRRHRVAMGTSPQPLAYICHGADGRCRQAVVLCGLPIAPNFHTIYAGIWGQTNRLAGKRLQGRPEENSPKDRAGLGGASCLQTLFCSAQADEWTKPSLGTGCLSAELGKHRQGMPSDILLNCMGVVAPRNPGQSLQVVQHFQATRIVLNLTVAGRW